MRQVGSILVFVLATLALGADCFAEAGKVPLNVLYLSRREDAEREVAFRDFLTSRFAKVNTAKRDEFQPSLLEGVDVVLLDWPQSERPPSGAASPLGPLENWKSPLVLLGSAGLLQAKIWSVIGSAG